MERFHPHQRPVIIGTELKREALKKLSSSVIPIYGVFEIKAERKEVP